MIKLETDQNNSKHVQKFIYSWHGKVKSREVHEHIKGNVMKAL